MLMMVFICISQFTFTDQKTNYTTFEKKYFFRLLIKTSFPEGNVYLYFAKTFEKLKWDYYAGSRNLELQLSPKKAQEKRQRKKDKKQETLISVNNPSHECIRM